MPYKYVHMYIAMGLYRESLPSASLKYCVIYYTIIMGILKNVLYSLNSFPLSQNKCVLAKMCFTIIRIIHAVCMQCVHNSLLEEERNPNLCIYNCQAT